MKKSINTTNKNCWQYLHEIINIKGTRKSHFIVLTSLDEINYRRIMSDHSSDPSLRTIISIGVGLSLDIETVDIALKLAGRSFKDQSEDRALRFCITGLSGHSIQECNTFLQEQGYEPLGSKQLK